MDSRLDEMHRRVSSKHVQPAIFGGPVLRMCSPGVQCSSDPMFLGSNISQVLCSPMHHMGSPRFICLQGLMFPGSTYSIESYIPGFPHNRATQDFGSKRIQNWGTQDARTAHRQNWGTQDPGENICRTDVCLLSSCTVPLYLPISAVPR